MTARRPTGSRSRPRVPPPRGWKVAYFRGTTNITSAVVAGTFRTASLAPGATYLIVAKITKGSGDHDPPRDHQVGRRPHEDRRGQVRLQGDRMRLLMRDDRTRPWTGRGVTRPPSAPHRAFRLPGGWDADRASWGRRYSGTRPSRISRRQRASSRMTSSSVAATAVHSRDRTPASASLGRVEGVLLPHAAPSSYEGWPTNQPGVWRRGGRSSRPRGRWASRGDSAPADLPGGGDSNPLAPTSCLRTSTPGLAGHRGWPTLLMKECVIVPSKPCFDVEYQVTDGSAVGQGDTFLANLGWVVTSGNVSIYAAPADNPPSRVGLAKVAAGHRYVDVDLRGKGGLGSDPRCFAELQAIEAASRSSRFGRTTRLPGSCGSTSTRRCGRAPPSPRM